MKIQHEPSFLTLVMRVAALLLTAQSAVAGGSKFALQPDLSSNQPVGTTITWSVVGPATSYDYRLHVGRVGESIKQHYGYTVRRHFQWTPMEEGLYRIVATVRDLSTLQTTQFERRFLVRPVAITVPVVSPTRNPQVALYSAPPCPAPGLMQVTLAPVEGGRRITTHPMLCNSKRSMNVYLGGMLADTVYRIRHIVRNGASPAEFGPPRDFATGIPTIELATVSVAVPAGKKSSEIETVILAGTTFGGAPPFAADIDGNIVWYYENPVELNIDFLMTRLLPGGTILLIGRTADADRFRLRQIDLAGNTVRETTVRAISEQYIALGGTDVIPAFHHEARLMPNGEMLVLGTIERLLTDVQGPGEVDIVGDVILSLDRNWNLTWSWNAFDHLDVTRAALQGETCTSNGAGCPVLLLAEEANDWIHANAIGYDPADGSLILSMRHQDWVAKIDYQNGLGDGTVLWRLGPDGDFAAISDEPHPWFTHQHDPNIVLNGHTLITFDNGNGNPACLANSDDCVSRGQAWILDEDAMTAELTLSADLQNYAQAVGSGQLLRNGNYSFNSGIIDGTATAKTDEITPEGAIIHSLAMDTRVYRSFRVKDLYTPPDYAEISVEDTLP